jgi:predicted Holliday junction resolvase-like endonuclease
MFMFMSTTDVPLTALQVHIHALQQQYLQQQQQLQQQLQQQQQQEHLPQQAPLPQPASQQPGAISGAAFGYNDYNGYNGG